MLPLDFREATKRPCNFSLSISRFVATSRSELW